MAACPSDRLSCAHAAPPVATSPGTSWAEAEQEEKRREELSLGEEETEEDVEEVQKISGSWKAVRRERHDWKGPKYIKCGKEIFSASLDELEGICAWLVPCQLLITIFRHPSRPHQEKEVSR